MEKNIRKIYFYRIMFGMMFSVPIIVLFWQRHGMSLTQVMVLQSLFATATVIFELPSGYLADIIGRRKSLVFSAAACLIAIAVYSQGAHFYHFLIAEICFAVGFALLSGADAAMVYDTLQSLGREHEFQEVYGKLIFVNLIAIGASSVLGGVIGAVHFRWTFYGTIPFFFIAVIIAITMEEPPRKQLSAESGYFYELLAILKYCFLENKRLCLLMVYSGIMLGLNNAALWFYQPYFKLNHMPIAWFGVAFASYQIFAAVCSRYAHAMERAMGQKNSLIILVICIGTGYFLMANVVFLWSFVFAFFHQFTRGFSRIVLTDYVNKLTTSDRRATVLSVQHLLMLLFYAMLIPVAGQIADHTSILVALQVLGVASTVIGLSLLIIMGKAKVL